MEAAATFAGFVSGKALDLMSLKDRYKLGVAVENKAVDMYETFIQMADTDPKLADLTDHLWVFYDGRRNAPVLVSRISIAA
ncbi:MAG: hypothetical protein FH756_03230 [Firmicutes bacterium]|nr:hypothetical protein [Bacillota bacterium]